MLNISSAARLFFCNALLFSQESGFFCFGFTTDAIGFFLRLSALGIDSGLFVSLCFLLCCNAVMLCLFSGFLLLTFSAFLR